MRSPPQRCCGKILRLKRSVDDGANTPNHRPIRALANTRRRQTPSGLDSRIVSDAGTTVTASRRSTQSADAAGDLDEVGPAVGEVEYRFATDVSVSRPREMVYLDFIQRHPRSDRAVGIARVVAHIPAHAESPCAFSSSLSAAMFAVLRRGGASAGMTRPIGEQDDHDAWRGTNAALLAGASGSAV